MHQQYNSKSPSVSLKSRLKQFSVCRTNAQKCKMLNAECKMNVSPKATNFNKTIDLCVILSVAKNLRSIVSAKILRRCAPQDDTEIRWSCKEKAVFCLATENRLDHLVSLIFTRNRPWRYRRRRHWDSGIPLRPGDSCTWLSAVSSGCRLRTPWHSF